MLDRLRPLFPYLQRYWKSLAWGGIAVVLYNVVKILIPLVIGSAIDDMQHGLTEAKVVHHAVRLLVIAFFAAVFLYITREVIIGASRDIEYDLRNDLFANLERQSASYFHTHRTGDIMARTTNDLAAVRQQRFAARAVAAIARPAACRVALPVTKMAAGQLRTHGAFQKIRRSPWSKTSQRKNRSRSRRSPIRRKRLLRPVVQTSAPAQISSSGYAGVRSKQGAVHNSLARNTD